MPGVSGVTVVTCLRALSLCTQGCGRIERPAFPAPPDDQKAGGSGSNLAQTCGEIATLYLPMTLFEI
jgi:hypothetical protein